MSFDPPPAVTQRPWDPINHDQRVLDPVQDHFKGVQVVPFPTSPSLHISTHSAKGKESGGGKRRMKRFGYPTKSAAKVNNV